MSYRQLVPALVVIAAVFPAAAQDVKPAKPLAVAAILSADEIDPARLLPPPPVEGGAVAAAELAEIRAIEKARSP